MLLLKPENELLEVRYTLDAIFQYAFQGMQFGAIFRYQIRKWEMVNLVPPWAR